MTGFSDFMDLGYFPLQDHAHGQDGTPVSSRQMIAGGRISRMTDPSVASDADECVVEYAKDYDMGTLGDVHPWLFWQTRDRGARGMGSWAGAFASIAVDADGYYANFDVQPLRDHNLKSDSRYRAIRPNWPTCFPRIPRGAITILMPGTDEAEQHENALWADPRLVAPSASGPGQCGTLVVDLQPSQELCMDGSTIPGVGGRHARLQTIFRVIAVPPNQGMADLGAGGNVVALNYGRTGVEGIPGFGAFFGLMESSSSGPITGGPGGQTGGPPGPITGGSSSLFGSLGVGAGSYGGDSPDGSSSSEEYAPADFGKFEPRKTAGHGIGLMANLGAAGPIHPGASGDKHRHGTDRDGHPINAAHISTNAYFYQNVERDAPIAFEGDYPYPSPLPIPAPAHISYASQDTHQFQGGSASGMWRLWCETPDISPLIPGIPKVPNPITGKPRTGGPTRPGGGGGGGGGPQPGGPGPIKPGGGGGGRPGGPSTGGKSMPRPPKGGGGGPSKPGGGGPITGDPGGFTGGNGGGSGGVPSVPCKDPGANGDPGGPLPDPGYPLPPGGQGGGGSPVGDPVTATGPVRPGGPGGGGTGGAPPGRGGPVKTGGRGRGGGRREPVIPGGTGLLDEPFPSDLRGSTDGGGSVWPVGAGETGRGSGGSTIKDPREELGRWSGLSQWERVPQKVPGLLERVGTATSEHVALYTLFRPMAQGFASLNFRPQLTVSGYPNFEHNPQLPPSMYFTDEEVRPQVLSMRAWGAQSDSEGEFSYVEAPIMSRARGGTGHGGIIFSPPRFELEDYYDVGAGKQNVELTTGANATTSYILAAPGVSYALGLPNANGTLAANSVTISQVPSATVAYKPLLVAHNGTKVIGAYDDGTDVIVELATGGNGAVVVPNGSSAQRPATPVRGMIRANTSGSNDVIEFYDSVSGWTTLAAGGGSGIDQLTGDVTAGPGTGSQVATIANSAVTLAKIANASASSKLVGSGASGSGSAYSELSIGTGLAMTGTTLAVSSIDGGSVSIASDAWSGALLGSGITTAQGLADWIDANFAP
jgi:hypothetical protein